MDATANKKKIEAMYGALTGGDGETFLAGFADDVQWRIIGTTALSRVYAGKAELVEKLLEPFGKEIDGDFTLDIQSLIAEDDRVVMQSQGRARTQRGKDYNNTYCHVFRFRGSEVAEVTEYLDTELVTEVFGS